jgi:hypothetical protein
MADLEETVAVEPVAVSSDTATEDIGAVVPESDAPSEAPSTEASTESVELDNTDGTEIPASTDDDDDKPVITRRNAKQIAAEAVQEALAAKERAAELERQLADQRKSEDALTAEMQSFVGDEQEVQSLRELITKPIPEVDTYDLDSVERQQQSIRERNAAMQRLAEINNRQELLPKMFSRIRSSFASSVYDVFDAVAQEHEGVDRTTFVDHLMADGLKPDEVKDRLKKAFGHLYEAGKTTGANEWKGRYEAEKKAHAVTKAASGGPSPTPESGGKSSVSGGLTAEKWTSMSAQERINLKMTAEGRAQIDAMTRTMNRGG